MLATIGTIILAVTVGIAYDWAIWSRLMQYLDPGHSQPDRSRWRDTLIPRMLLLAIASIGVGIEIRHPFPGLRYLSIAVFVIGIAWGILLAWRRLHQD